MISVVHAELEDLTAIFGEDPTPQPESVPTPEEKSAPDWLDEIEESADESVVNAELDDLTAIFGDDEIPESDPAAVQGENASIPEWMQEMGDEKPDPIPDLTIETQTEMSVPETTEELEPEPAAQTVEAPAVESQVEEPPDKPIESDELVTEAKTAVQTGELEDAVKHFSKIIKKGKVVDQAIVEIKEALRRHPINVELWQVLGDAYMKVNNLQDALDAYSKAENLLR